MDRGSDKHNPRLDEQMKHEVEGIVQSGHDTHAEEWASPEPPGEDQPEVDRGADAALHGGVPDGMSEEDVEGRAELAAWLGRAIFPAVREQLLEHVIDNGAPDPLVERVRRLPSGREFENPGDVWRALSGGVEAHRF